MQESLLWGSDVVVWFQQYSPQWDLFFELLTLTGNEPFYLFILPLLAWSINRRVAIPLLILLLLSFYLNDIFKILLDQPRPFDFDPRVIKISDATGGGMPSGHTQNALIFWGYLIYSFRQKWLHYLAGAMILLVPLSRVYLGVHFPADLLGGYLIGAILLFLWIKFKKTAIEWLVQKNFKIQMILSISLPLLLLLFYPKNSQIVVALSGTLLGALVGLTIERRVVKYQIPAELKGKRINYALGSLVLIILYLGLQQLFASLKPESVYRFIRYTVIGLHFTLIAPWIFVQLNLTNRQ